MKKTILILGKYYDSDKVVGGVEFFNKNLQILFSENQSFNFIYLRNKKSKFYQLLTIIVQIIFAPKYSILWINSAGYDNLVVFFKFFKSLRILYTVHSLEKVSKKGYINQKQFFLEKLIFPLIDKFIFPTNNFYSDSKKQYKIFNDNNSSVIYHPFLLTDEYFVELPTENVGKYFLSIGNFAEEKGVDKIYGILNVIKNIKETKLVWLGLRINHQPKFIEIFKSLTHPELLLGKPYTYNIIEKRIWIKQSKILIVPSNYDTFSFAIVEAAYEGIPIIASKNVGLSELIILHKAGKVVDFNSENDLEEAIHDVLDNWEMYSQNSLKMFDEFNAEKSKKSYISLF